MVKTSSLRIVGGRRIDPKTIPVQDSTVPWSEIKDFESLAVAVEERMVMDHAASPLNYKKDKTVTISGWGTIYCKIGFKKRLLNLASLPPILPVLN